MINIRLRLLLRIRIPPRRIIINIVIRRRGILSTISNIARLVKRVEQANEPLLILTKLGR